jgi:hypothetical protein
LARVIAGLFEGALADETDATFSLDHIASR